VWHLHYAWRFTNLARISLDIDFDFLRIKNCWFLSTIYV